MANSFGSSNSATAIATNVLATLKPTSGWAVVAAFVALAILVVVAYTMWPRSPTSCPKELHRNENGHLSLKGTGKIFSDMNEFQQWWHSSGESHSCPLPRLTGAREEQVLLDTGGGGGGGWPNEQTSAKTPIYKVDDYEFSRIFGYEKGGHMIVPRENYNKILQERALDWADLPTTAEARAVKYAGLTEGFTASGHMDSAREATQRYGEKAHAHEYDQDVECKLSREAKEVAAMVAKAYEDDPNYEPVITKVGPNHWEVNELKPRRRHVAFSDPVNNRVVDTDDTKVAKEFVYENERVNRAAIDPFFPPTDGQLPWQSDRYQPVMEMDRMMGPTFDREDWAVPVGPHPLMTPS